MNIIAKNRKFDHLNEIYYKLVAGISLSGNEVVSIRNGSVSIDNSYVYHKSGEMYVYNLIISKSNDNNKIRKLLLKKKEILYLINDIKIKKISIIPISVFTKGRWIKIEICAARKLKKYQLKKKEKMEKELKKSDKNFFVYDD